MPTEITLAASQSIRRNAADNGFEAYTGTTPAAQGATASLASSLTARGVVVTATNEATTNGAVGDIVSVHFQAEAEFIQ